ncbi:MAG: type II toxin-antitoxin system VapC family toxin [Rubrobacteraceae bacterium]
MSYPFREALLDTFVIVKWFVPEEDSERALNLRRAQEGRELQLYAPEVLLMELANALRYSSEFSTSEIAGALETPFELNMLLMPFSLSALNSAVTLSLEHDLAVYDAYFLALAQALEIPLITADRKMLSRLTPEDGAVDLKSL